MKKALKTPLVIISIIITTLIAIISYNLIIHAIYPIRYYDYIEKYSEKYNLDEYLVMGVIKAESNYIYDAYSGIAGGLMQITDETASWICKQLKIKFNRDDIVDPEKNIEMGCFYLNYLISHYNNNIDVALAAYNAGMGNVNKWLSNSEYSRDGITLSYIPYDETREYIKKVNKYKETYKKLYASDDS